MAKAATSPELKTAFQKHLKETEGQIERLDEVFKVLNEKATRKTCKDQEDRLRPNQGVRQVERGFQVRFRRETACQAENKCCTESQRRRGESRSCS